MDPLRIEVAESVVLELSLDDLAALPGQVRRSSMLFRGAEVTGICVAHLLSSCGIGAVRATFVSAGGETTSLDAGMLASAVLVYRIGEDPVPSTCGGPIRLLVVGEQATSLPSVVSISTSAPERKRITQPLRQVA